MNSAARRFTLCPQRNVLRKRIDLAANLIANATRFLQALLVRAGEFRRIVERPVNRVVTPGKNRQPSLRLR